MKHFPILAAALLAGACATAPRTTLSGLDPEGVGNMYQAQYPMSRQFTFGLDLMF